MKSSKLLRLIPFSIICVVVSPVFVQAQDAQSREEFDAIFKERIAEVRKTESMKDDQELADEMISYLEFEDLSDNLKTLMARSAFDLTIENPDATEVADHALAALQLLAPDEALKAKEKLLTRQVDMLRSAPVDEREQRTEDVYEELMSYAALLVSNAQPEKASEIYLQAMTLARNLDKSHMEAARDARSNLKAFIAAKEQLNAQVKAYQSSGSKEAAAEIATKYLVYFYQPRRAMDYAQKSGDANLVLVAQTCIKSDLADVPAADLIKVGTWFEANAEAAPEQSQRAVYERALSMLETAMQQEGLRELDRLRANVKINEINTHLADLPESPKMNNNSDGLTADTENPDEPEWKNGTLKLSDSFKKFIEEKKPADWFARGRSFIRAKNAVRAPIDLGVKPGNNYSLRILVTPDRAGGGLELELPVGQSNMAPVKIVCGGRNYTQEHDGRLTMLYGRINVPERRTAVVVHVKIVNERAAVEVDINGKAVTNWTGPVDHLPRRSPRLILKSVDAEANLRIDSIVLTGQYLE